MSRIDENQEDGSRLDQQYTNYLKIGHNSFELLLNFGLQTLEQYEQSFGPLEATELMKEP